MRKTNIGLLLAAVALPFLLTSCGSMESVKELSQRDSPLKNSDIRNADMFSSKSKYLDPRVKPQKPSKPTTLPGGLVCQDIEQGWGMSPSANRQVYVHYTGYLSNGAKFESSLDKGMPFIFTIGSGKVIAGFEKGLMGMKVGGKRKLTIPPNLAYGSSGRKGKVPPNETLTYDVQLLCSDR
jgi:FKBP-type peptidyl-prolyl cis-trans isomerase